MDCGGAPAEVAEAHAASAAVDLKPDAAFTIFAWNAHDREHIAARYGVLTFF
jgi:hypothetical protein